MSAHSTEISVSARYADLPGLMDAVARAASALNWAAADIQRLQLVLEELFINTISHGHGGDCAARVWVHVNRLDERLTLRYRDSAPAFNVAAATASPASDDRIGGLGLGLIQGMTSAIRYRRDGECNVTELDFVAGSGSCTQSQ